MSSPSAVGDEQPNKRQCPSGTNDRSDSSGEVSMRTVCIRGTIHRLTIDKITDYFGQFGGIESVSMRFEDTRTRWCLVQFKRAKDAEEALLRTGNHWLGYDVEAAGPWHQPDHPLQVAPEQDSDSNISVALNDDCLQAIFERLKPSSLTSVAGVCKRFNEQAKIVFALKHKHLDLDKQFQSHLIETAMKYFGKDIKSLSVGTSSFPKEADAYQMIAQNCGPQLKQLEFGRFRFGTDPRSLRPIFSQIEQLKLYRCANSIGLGELMAGCGELKSLSLSFCVVGDDQNILSRAFPRLQEFSIHRNHISDETLERFVSRHPALIKLSIENERLTPRLFRVIGQHTKQLQELKFFGGFYNHHGDNQFQNDAAYIAQLSSLKKLQLDFGENSMVSVLNALIAGEVPIECMKIQFDGQPDIDQAIKCISQLKRIKVLQLGTGLDTRQVMDENIVELAKCLPELEELHLEESHWLFGILSDHVFNPQLTTIGLRKMLMHASKLKLLEFRGINSIKIDVDDYKAMLSMVQKRKEKVPLAIEVDGRADHVDVLAAVLGENRSTLDIKLIR